MAEPNVNPGNIAWLGAGWAGIICVVLAGWTTANPTLYRAGLAFQVATPNWRRWAVTMFAGVMMIVIACIPAVNYYLDRIVAYNALFFMPLGAFIFIDFWLFPRLGLTRLLCRAETTTRELARSGRLVRLLWNLLPALRQGPIHTV